MVPIEAKSGKAYKTHKALDNFMENPDYHIEKAYVLSAANVEQEGTVGYLPIYMCYLLKEWRIGKLIVDLELSRATRACGAYVEDRFVGILLADSVYPVYRLVTASGGRGRCRGLC